MKILILWSGVHIRDLAQKDMYDLVGCEHEVRMVEDNEFFDAYNTFKPDLVWFDIYHSRSAIDWDRAFKTVTVPVIIDQADNELFVKNDKKFKFDKYVITSRYLPNKSITKYNSKYGCKTMLLRWYVDPDRFKPQQKTIDVGFVCWPKGRREDIGKQLKEVCQKNNLSYIDGNFYGEEYYQAVSKCKVFVVECDRKCVTQKYIEASLAGCTLAGDVPEFPGNDLEVYPFELGIEEMIKEALKDPFVNKIENEFINDFNKIVCYFNK